MARDVAVSPCHDLEELLRTVPAVPTSASLGQDIDEANAVLLDPSIRDELKIARFRSWASRHQPCMFGRLGAKNVGGIRYDCCWINRDDLRRGSPYVASKIQQTRAQWKLRASEGLSHGLIVMFNAPELAFAKPGPQLVQLCLALCNLYLIEHAPVSADTIYVESLPLKSADGSVSCLKGGINVFYSTAHRTGNHDRRIPGGIMISVNSPGLLAHSLVKRGLAPDLSSALKTILRLARASIGNGGMSREVGHQQSCSWHNVDTTHATGQCPMRRRPNNMPDSLATGDYSALYHTDVLVPSKVMADSSQDVPRDSLEVWPQLDLKYLSATELAAEHENFGFVHGKPVAEENQLQHTWAPIAAPDHPNEAHQS
ncbi:MAG: hypothetical protein ABSE43_03715 [Steroidobacteraceae bacterium]